MSRERLRKWALVLLGSVAATLGAGCGRPATRDECLAILDKSAELKLKEQKLSDPEQIAHRKKQLMDAKGEDLIGQCVGMRITEGALRCVQRAESPAAVDRCLY